STTTIEPFAAHTFKLPSPCETCTTRGCKSDSSSSSCPFKHASLPSLSSSSTSSSPSKHVKLDQWEADLEREIISSWDYQSW
ncbi:hypothetical protein JCM8547_003737, partial [Rhodosporidiobolus lusitaniae]